MSQVSLSVAALVAVVAIGCTAGEDEPQITGLRIFEQDDHEVSGTFVEGERSLDFSFTADASKRTATIRSADGRPLIQSTLTNRVETTIYLGRVTLRGTYEAEPALSGDATAIAELVTLPEAQLVEPLRRALAHHGVAKDLYAVTRSGSQVPCVAWSWWARCDATQIVSKL